MRKLFDLLFDWFWVDIPEPFIRQDHTGFVDDEMLQGFRNFEAMAELHTRSTRSLKENEND
jgi:hypothetical protein